MKIRPTDPSQNLPPEPEEVGQKKTADAPVDQTLPADAKPVRAKDPSGISSEVLTSLGKIKDRGELGRKIVDLALDDFRSAVPAEVLENIQGMLVGQVGDDPYIQEKLDRISSLLDKAR